MGSPRSMSKRGFSLPPVSGRTSTCWVSMRTSPWKVEKTTPIKSGSLRSAIQSRNKRQTRVLLLGSTHVLMQAIEQPSEELDRISLLFKTIFPDTRPINLL